MSAPSRSPLPAAYEALQPPTGPRRRPSRRNRSPLHAILALLAAIVVVVGAVGLWSVVGAYSKPGNESFSAKWADWMRAHGMGPLVSSFESYYYTAHQPKKGGTPKGLNPIAQAQGAGGTPKSPAGSSPVATTVPAIPALPAPSPVPLVVSPALSEEGQWLPVGPKVGGTPAMYEAQFRADTTFTSQITTAVWMDPLRLHISLVPGLTEPGGTWTHPPYITPTEAPDVLAAFNGGFRFQDAHGGFYLDGRTAVPLRAGAVRAMTLDINPEWVTFNIYSHPDPASPSVISGTKLYPQMQRSSDRYVAPTDESRDFFEVSVPAS